MKGKRDKTMMTSQVLIIELTRGEGRLLMTLTIIVVQLFESLIQCHIHNCYSGVHINQ